MIGRSNVLGKTSGYVVKPPSTYLCLYYSQPWSKKLLFIVGSNQFSDASPVQLLGLSDYVTQLEEGRLYQSLPSCLGVQGTPWKEGHEEEKLEDGESAMKCCLLDREWTLNL